MAVFSDPIRLAFGLVLALVPAAVWADSVDGTWCSADSSRSIQVSGSDMITPAGNKVTGQYSRHAAAYLIPETEAGAGGSMLIQLLNEDEAQVSAPEKTPELWRRCQLHS